MTTQSVQQSFRLDKRSGEIVREVRAPSGAVVESRLPYAGVTPIDLSAAYDLAWLRADAEPRFGSAGQGKVRCVDLFCGLGGMSLGLQEACRALGKELEIVLAADSNSIAGRVYEAFHPGTKVEAQPIETWLDGELGKRLTKNEKRLKGRLGHVSVVTGGPPCQGHSNLNNHTRRRDPKNALYARMARFAEVVEPDHVIIENVPGVEQDEGGVMALTCDALREKGYAVHPVLIRAERFGVPQTRHRMFVVASRVGPLRSHQLEALLSRHEVDVPRHVLWAIGDLADSTNGTGFNRVGVPKPETQRRIDWFFRPEHRDTEYDLPNKERPACHQKPHRYVSVYGRMRPREPAPTITTGFMVMGQGRFVHPTRPRTLTPREGARLQFLPDWLGFPDDLLRKDYARLIGNAVPPKLTYLLGLELLAAPGDQNA